MVALLLLVSILSNTCATFDLIKAFVFATESRFVFLKFLILCIDSGNDVKKCLVIHRQDAVSVIYEFIQGEHRVIRRRDDIVIV